VTKQFNLEEEFGWVLDGIEDYIDDNPEDFLEHNGVKGMKWGRRKSTSKSDRPELKGLGPDKIVRKTKYGEEMTLSKDRPTAIHKALGRMSKKYRESYESGAFLTIRDSNGKKVGDASVEKKNADELYLNWLGVDKSARGKGYASAVMKASTEFGKEAGFKKLTLEVPGDAPDALHIYTKLGFKKTGEVSGSEGDIWGGLTSMEYVFADVKHQQVDDFLEHVGVLGMKWGKRRGSLKTRVTGAAHDRNQRDIAMVKRQLSGNGTRSEKIIAAPIKMMIGENQLNRNYNMSMNQLLAQRDRIETGRQDINDKIQTLQRTSVLDLFVSVTDTRE